MAQIKYAGSLSLQAVADKVKELLNGKVNVEAGKGLSTNDMTNALKANYDAAYTHSQAAHAPTNAQENVIESISVNGEPLEVSAKAVDITVPTKVSDLTNDSGFQTSSDVTGAINTALGAYSTTEAMNTAIASAIAAAPHLKRIILGDSEELPEVGSADANAIYMKKKTSAQSQNTYTEYMVINNAWEIVGDTAVDLTDYAKTTEVQQMITTALTNYVTSESLTQTLAKYVTSESLTSTLANYVLHSEMVEITAGEVNAMFDDEQP